MKSKIWPSEPFTKVSLTLRRSTTGVPTFNKSTFGATQLFNCFVSPASTLSVSSCRFVAYRCTWGLPSASMTSLSRDWSSSQVSHDMTPAATSFTAFMKFTSLWRNDSRSWITCGIQEGHNELTKIQSYCDLPAWMTCMPPNGIDEPRMARQELLNGVKHVATEHGHLVYNQGVTCQYACNVITDVVNQLCRNESPILEPCPPKKKRKLKSCFRYGLSILKRFHLNRDKGCTWKKLLQTIIVYFLVIETCLNIFLCHPACLEKCMWFQTWTPYIVSILKCGKKLKGLYYNCSFDKMT